MKRADTNLRNSVSCRRALGITLAVLGTVIWTTNLSAQILGARGPEKDLRLVRTAGEHRLVLPDGSRVPLPLSTVASVGDFRKLGGDWIVAAADRRNEDSPLVILEGRNGKFDSLPAPAVDAELSIREPKLLVDGDRLEGLVWLEGKANDRLAVHAARWTSGAWEPTAIVSPVGSGTQIALTVTVLADGTWLAAWAAFDGQDDEIMWSRRQPDKSGIWSPPRPIAQDDLPDVTPALFATADSALLAWSSYDGHDYRVQLARFEGDEWTEPKTLGGRGTAFPEFGDERAPILLYRQAAPHAWRIVELDEQGRVVRKTAEAPADRFPPIVAEVGDAGVVLEWAEKSATVPWQEQPSAAGEGSGD